MAWFSKTRASLDASEKQTIGKGVFRRCDECGTTLRAEEFTENLEVCPQCQHHYPLSAESWVDLLLDPGSFEETDTGLLAGDPLAFNDSKPYPDRVKVTRKKTGVDDAMMVGEGTIESRPVQLGTFVFRFMGGSMGSVVGEKITRMFERGTAKRQPVILLSASGGARMQEGVLSLMQMAKTVSALGRLRAVGMPFISVLLHPTTGGVAASFALLGDVNVINMDTLAAHPPQIVHDLPAGGRRLMQTASGYKYTVKTGTVMSVEVWPAGMITKPFERTVLS